MNTFSYQIYFLLLISCISTSSVQESSKDKREIKKFEKEAIKIIGDLSAKLAEEAFFFDPILFQTPDKVNSKTEYHMPEDNSVVYTRNADDTGKDVIVLAPDEDHIGYKKKKRVYTVLRKNTKPKSTQNEYYAFIAYVRDAGKKDKKTKTIDGGSYAIEYDQWDDHFLPGGSVLTLNSIFCSSSIILPCLFGDTPPEEGKDGVVKAAKRYVPKNNDFTTDVLNISDKIVVDVGKPDDSYDLFRDIDFQKMMDGRATVTYETTYAHDGNPGLLGSVARGVCGILGAVFGGNCNRRKQTTVTVNNDIGVVGYNPYGYTAGGPYVGAVAPAYVGAPVAYQPQAPVYNTYGRKKREGEEPNMALDFPGWKTQFTTAVKGIYLKPESLPFYGFGNCPAKELTKKDLDNAKTGEQLVDYYLTLLRTECVSLLKNQLLKLLEINALQVKDKTLTIHDDVIKAGNPKFTLHEMISSQTAVEISAFSTTYIKLSKEKAPKPTSPDGSAISRSVNIVVELMLNIISKSREFGRSHMTARTRHAITAARYAFSKVTQDMQSMQDCKDCAEDLKLNYSDRLVIMALIQYLKYGTRDIDLNNKDIHKSFKTFFTKNKKLIVDKVGLHS